MPIPAFNIDGIIPPFIGPDGPGDSSEYMTPYVATASEVIARFGTTANRCEILAGWLAHRALLYSLDVITGFQWLDGSFMENKEPNDLDVVTFFHRPQQARQINLFAPIFLSNPQVFDHDTVKANHRLDAFFNDMDATVANTIDFSAYFLGLFSHRREGSLWKGMVRVAFDATDDAAAQTILSAMESQSRVAAP